MGCWHAFELMYFGAVVHAQYHVINVLENYFAAVMYPEIKKGFEQSTQPVREGALESIKDPLNMLFGTNEHFIKQFLENFQNLNGDHFSEQLCLRILRAVPKDYQCDPWLIQRIAIRLGSEKVVDYCLDRWLKEFKGDVFGATHYAANLKFSIIKYFQK